MIKESYDVLRKPAFRKQYDQGLKVSADFPPPPSEEQDQKSKFDFSDMKPSDVDLSKEYEKFFSKPIEI